MNGRSTTARMDAREAVRSQATQIARGWSAPGAPSSWQLTALLFDVLANDEALLTLAAPIPADRLPALLFVAAACYLVDEHRPPALASSFPTEGGEQPPLDPDLGPRFAMFCLEHGSELQTLCRRHRYQMTEVARSTQISLGLGALTDVAGGRAVGLIDVGTGAGLGLQFDRLCHRLNGGRQWGDPGSPLVLDCEVGGDIPPPVPVSAPVIARRLGIDVEPTNLDAPSVRRWLRSCIPPEAGARARFDLAVALARAHPCTTWRADALDVLPRALEAVPDEMLPVVVDSYTAVFFSDRQRARLMSLLEERGRCRDLAWISLDPLVPLGTAGRHSVQGLDVPDDLVTASRQGGVFALLGVVTFERGRRAGRLLARAHPSGTSVTWLDDGHARPAIP